MTAPEVEQNDTTLLRQPDPQLATMAAASVNIPGFKDLIAVLFECFIIITLGYLSCRFKLISHQAKDLNSYLTTFALPMIIFLNIAQMEFQTINISFLICMLVSKLVVFIIVTVLTLAISHPRNFSFAGALSILATQSNDFALGYPLIKSLHGDTKPEMLTYLSLMAPIQLLILNPLGIAMLEYQKYKQMRRLNQENSLHVTTQQTTPCKRCGFGISPTSSTNQATNSFKSIIQTTTSHSNAFNPLTAREVLNRTTTTTATIPKNLRLDDNLLANDERSKFSNEYIGTDDKSGNVSTSAGTLGRNRSRRMLMLTLPSVIGSSSEESLDNLNDTLCKSNEQVYQENSRPPQVANNSPTMEQISSSQDLKKPYISRSISPAINSTQCSCQSILTRTRTPPTVNLNFLKALLTNPLIIASAVALMVNLINGPELPRFVTRFSSTIAASFASPALFVVGLQMYGKFELLLKNPNDLLLSSVLVLTKIIILPNLMRTFALMIIPAYTLPAELPYLVDFAFLYGTLPTAPGACIIANQYDVLSNVVSITMSLSTFMSAPLLIASAVIVSPSEVISALDIEKLILQTLKAASLITLILAPLSLYGFWKSSKKLKYNDFISMSESTCRSVTKFKANPYQIFLLLLALSQTLVAFGGLLWFLMDISKGSLDIHTLRTISNLESDLTSIDSALSRNIEDIIHPDTIHHPDTVALPAPLTYPFPVPDPETSNLVEPLESRTDQIHLSFNQKTLSMAHYVFSSTGLMMARFVVLGLIITLAAFRLRDRITATKVSTFMVKSYAVIGTAIVIGLTFESDKQKHVPIEAILPGSTESLIVRLVYNIIFLAISIPCFALIVRFDNKNKTAVLESAHVSHRLENSIDSEVGSDIVKRRYLTSSASLSSDTSSALTANTNLEPLTSSNQYAPILYDITNVQTTPPLRETLPAYLDAGLLEVSQRPVESHNTTSTAIIGDNSHRSTGKVATVTESSELKRDCDTEELRGCRENISTRFPNPSQVAEFNKYSILIVFTMFDSVLSLTSITQALLQDQPFGTFRQIEVMKVALEFGQGLLTFMIYGMRGVLV